MEKKYNNPSNINKYRNIQKTNIKQKKNKIHFLIVR